MFKLSQKGVSEIISYIVVIVIVVGVVGMIYSGVMPNIKKTKSQNKFLESQNYIEQINSKINEIMLSPNGSTTSIQMDLGELYLEVDSIENKIEISHVFYGDYFKAGERITEGNIYKVINQEKLVVGINLENIDIQENLYITNSQITLYIKKIDRNKINISRELDSSIDASLKNVERERPAKDYIYDNWHNTNWKNRQLITIDENKVVEDINNFVFYFNSTLSGNPSKTDGSDIIFTNFDGSLKYDREIIDYNYSTKKLVASVKIPVLSSTEDTLLWVYYNNSNANETNSNVNNNLLLWFNAKINASYPKNGNQIKDLVADLNWSFDSSKISYNSEKEAFFFPTDTVFKSINTNNSLTLSSDTNSLTYYYIAELKSENTSSYPSLFFDTGQGLNPFVWIYVSSTNNLNIQHTTKTTYSVRGSSNYFLNNKDKLLQIVISFQYDLNNSQVKFYRDGNLINTVNFTISYFPDANTIKRVGNYSTSSSHNWQGYIQEFRLYDKILSANEINTIYNNEVSPQTFYSLGDIE